MSELLVLGNGFDVACGLKSTYTDFYNDRYFEIDKETDKPIFKEINEILNKNIEDIEDISLLSDEEMKVSFWDFIFCQERLFGKNWTDVEEVLADKISSFSDLYIVFEDPNNDVDIRKVHDTDISAIEVSDFNPTTTTNMITSEFRKLAKIFLIFIKVRYSNIKVTSSQDDIANILLKELILFEENFQKYLLNEVVSNNNYDKNFRTLYDELTGRSVGQYDRKIDSEIYVMSFNYTTLNGLEESSPDITYNNIHGKLSMQNNIFGVDITRDEHRDNDMELMGETERFEDIFLKTYRTLSLPNEERFYNNNVKVIRFYGHSLAQADYIYFKVIFDSLDLFNGDTQLIFFYSNYKDIEGNFVNEKNNQINRVRKLLLKYESSLISKGPYKGYIFDKLRTQGRLTFIDVTKTIENFEVLE